MLALIGGTGFGDLSGLQDRQPEIVNTEFGSAYLERGVLSAEPIIFLPRHGKPAQLPPHKINYRANIKALQMLGVTQIIAVTAVGSVDSNLHVAELVIPDQIIDYTYGRSHTYFDDRIHHIDFTYPYDPTLRRSLIAAVKQVPDSRLCSQGVYGCTQGPRLETAAEIKKMHQDGCTIVGMTAMPEAALVRELGMAYAGISVVVNDGAGINDAAIDIDGIKANLALGMSQVATSIEILLKNNRS